MKVLVAGGAGYIGSHICVELLQANHEVVVIDDFSNSKPEVLGYIKDITGKEVKFYEFNILDEKKTEEVFKENDLDAVIHCAAFKAVGESVEKPIEYYTNNLTTTLIVAKMMKKYHVNNIVFSSSAILLKSCLRMKPDRILLAELRGGETYDYLNVLNSGHGGSITSLHSGSVRETFTRLALMILQNPQGQKLPFEIIKKNLDDVIDVVVHIQAHNGERNISDIYYKGAKDEKSQ